MSAAVVLAEPTAPAARGRRGTVLLAVGAAGGLVVALAQLVGGDARRPPTDAVATVNGERISRDDFARALAAVRSDRHTPLDDAERRHILDRLVDEELLLQRGLELGLARQDARVRGALVHAVVEMAIADAATSVPSPGDVEAYHAAHPDDFAQAGRLRVAEVLIASADDAAARAAEAARRLRSGEPVDVVRAALGRDDPAPPPDAMLPPSALPQYVGGSAAVAVAALPADGVTDPIETPAGWRVLVVLEREARQDAPVGEVADVVREEIVRRRGDDALRAYLASLRAGARIDVADDAR